MFTFNLIGPLQAEAPGNCTYDPDPNSTSYQWMVGQTKGVQDEICNANWAQALKDLGKTAFGFRTSFFLNASPDFTGGKQIVVKVDGVVAPSTDWSYDAAANAVKFIPAKTPGPGQTLSISYYVGCL
jgi:hypothetical protein